MVAKDPGYSRMVEKVVVLIDWTLSSRLNRDWTLIVARTKKEFVVVVDWALFLRAIIRVLIINYTYYLKKGLL